MSGHAVLLVNPASAKGGSRRVAEETRALLTEAGWRTRVVAGSDPEASLAELREAIAAGTDRVVAVGGDGTVHLAVQALARTGVPLAVVPAGTGNDFARALRIPRRSAREAVRLLTEGRRREVDLARAGGRWYATVLCSGFDALVSERTNTLRYPSGPLRYYLAIAVEALRLRPLPFRLRVDGTTVEQDATLIAVGNTDSYGGGLRICPRADTADGLLEVTLVHAGGIHRLAGVLARMRKGTHLDHPRVSTYRGHEITLDSPGGFAYADGERLGDLPLTVTCVPAALTVLVEE